MEFIIGISIGIVGIILTIYFGIRSKKYENALKNYHEIDLEKRKLIEKLINPQREQNINLSELNSNRKIIRNLDNKQDNIFNPRDYPQPIPCPKCGEEMYMDDVDYYYECRKCGYEIYAEQT